MSTHFQVFSGFSGFLHLFVLAKLATSRIKVRLISITFKDSLTPAITRTFLSIKVSHLCFKVSGHLQTRLK